MNTAQDLTRELLTVATRWAAEQAAALPDHARWAVTKRLDLEGWDVVLAISLQHGVARVFIAGDDGQPELAAAMQAEAAE